MNSAPLVRLCPVVTGLAAFFAAALLSLGAAQAKGVTILYSFCSQVSCADGAGPAASLTADFAGNLYGTTLRGGAHGQGTIFKLTPGGAETVLYSFTGGNDGGPPAGKLLLDSQGDFYGTAGGGAHGQGVVFKLAPDGAETVVYAFTGSDGGPPFGSLSVDAQGNLYGVGAGGIQNCFGGCGTIFKLAPDGAETVLYAFCAETDCLDGEFPNGDLVLDKDGNVYGTTKGGGGHGVVAAGMVFEVTAKGREKVLWSFCSRPGCDDGEAPLAGLVRDRAGNLYGTTDYGGNPVGTLFKLAPDGTETVLYGFTGRSDGGNPQTLLTADDHGNLYGTTQEYGGKCLHAGGCGTIYKLAPDGSFTVLYTIGLRLHSASGLTENQGRLYGTSPSGGAQKAGTVFALRK